MADIFGEVTWIQTGTADGPAGDLPVETHRGILRLGGVELEVVQLNNGMRLITQESVDKFFGEDIGKLVAMLREIEGSDEVA